MRPIAISTRGSESYVLKDNREDPDDQQVKFTIRRALPLHIRQQILNAVGMDENQNITPAIGTRYILACRYGITGWEGLQDDRGQPVPCERKDGMLTMECLEKFDDAWIIELGMEILERSTIDAEQVEK